MTQCKSLQYHGLSRAGRSLREDNASNPANPLPCNCVFFLFINLLLFSFIYCCYFFYSIFFPLLLLLWLLLVHIVKYYEKTFE